MLESPTAMTGPITSIRRGEIPAHGLQLVVIWDAALLEQLPEQGFRPDIEAPLRLQARLGLDGSRVTLDATCQAQVICTCVRCLERFAYPLSLSFRYVFQPAGSKNKPGNAQIDPADIEAADYDGDHIDLVAPVCEQIYLGLPAYPHCSPGCRGLCPQCGANLNNGTCACDAGPGLQSSFAALGRLKKKA